MNSPCLRGRVALVTGATPEIATALATEGMSLCLVASTGGEVRQLGEDLAERFGVRCFPAAIDVADEAAVFRVVTHVEQQLGAIDLLVNGADPVVMTNVVLPTMLQRGRGHIINVTDGHAVTHPGPGVVALDVPADRVAGLAVAVATGEYDERTTHA